jgi:hypothetical protein
MREPLPVRSPSRAALAALLLAACGGGSPPPAGPGDDPPFDPPSGAEVRLDTDPLGEELSVFPRIARSGERLYVAWYDRRLGDVDVFFNRSLDGGDTWLADDVRLDTTAGATGALIPDLAADGDDVAVVWQDRRDGLPDVRFNRSTDAGTTWLPLDVRLDSGPAGGAASLEPRIARAGARLYVVWEDLRDGLGDVYFNRSVDGGATWLPADVRLDTDAPGSGASHTPRVACEGDLVLVAWADARSGETDVRVNRSTDGGLTWLPADVRVDTDLPEGGALSDFPVPSIEGGVAAVLWEDGRDGERDVRASRSSDGGATWLASDVRVDTDAAGAGDSIRVRTARSAGVLHAVWEDHRSGLADVRYSRSADGGATWLPADVRLDLGGAGVASSFAPDVGADGPDVSAVWADDRRGRFDVLLRRSEDAGLSWLPGEVRLDQDPEGAGHSTDPRLAVGGGATHVVWHDQRDGPGDVYYSSVP